MPDFLLNLFLPAKKPLHGRPPKAVANLGVSVDPFWKFPLTKHQQAALEKLG